MYLKELVSLSLSFPGILEQIFGPLIFDYQSRDKNLSF